MPLLLNTLLINDPPMATLTTYEKDKKSCLGSFIKILSLSHRGIFCMTTYSTHGSEE